MVSVAVSKLGKNDLHQELQQESLALAIAWREMIRPQAARRGRAACRNAR